MILHTQSFEIGFLKQEESIKISVVFAAKQETQVHTEEKVQNIEPSVKILMFL